VKSQSYEVTANLAQPRSILRNLTASLLGLFLPDAWAVACRVTSRIPHLLVFAIKTDWHAFCSVNGAIVYFRGVARL
jgi:hypothetical protein